METFDMSENTETLKICEKWYKKLGFPTEFDAEFYNALKKIQIPETTNIYDYNLDEQDGKRNLAAFLYMCEELNQKYTEKGIEKQIFFDTLKELVRWTRVWSDIKGELYLGELKWLSLIMKMELFRIGELEFIAKKSTCTCSELGLKQGDNIVEVHIPEKVNLSPEAVKRSFKLANDFYAKYYPEYKYSHYTCFSWLLDEGLSNFLSSESNIIQFQKMFTLVQSDRQESDFALKFIFKWDTTRDNLKNAVCISGFAEKIKAYALSGGKLYACSGVIKKQ